MDAWAPQSPDLTSAHAADTDTEPVHPQHQGYRGSLSHAAPSLPSYVPPGVRTAESMQDADYAPDASLAMPPLAALGNGSSGASMLPPNADSITIKNHFPVARIKRIMQADDDVGKVAQVTPVVVSKALELFMISLVTKAAAEAKQRNSKRVGAIHLKQAITKNEQFDFLNDIVSKVADAPEKNESDAMDEGRKKKPLRGRRKKADDDDES
ncbi:histone-fold-containing protein [Lizonia empirigonia]|nr:histone-fold-containing protein [Lizonia empirigonia]